MSICRPSSNKTRKTWRICGDPIGSCSRIVPLLEAHSLHDDIRGVGQGRYSHWRNALLFSTSDNSDAQTNGRVYALRWKGAGAKPWLPQLSLPAADCDHRRWSAPAKPVARCEGVIAVVGDSFSGSTVLNCVLGAHSQIFGASELRWLVETPDEVGCAVCGSACTMWTPGVLRRVGQSPDLYDAVSRRFGRHIVCDSSKTPAWFSPALRGLEAPVVRVLLTKHPLRHVASHLSKTTGPVTRQRLDAILAHLRAFHGRVLLKDEMTLRRAPAPDGMMICDLHLRYEDFAADPLGSLSPVLVAMGLSPEPGMLDWARAPAHPIGGNIAPLIQICNAVHPMAVGRDKYRRRGIFLDESYRQTLDQDGIDYILSHADARWLADRFYASAEPARTAA